MERSRRAALLSGHAGGWSRSTRDVGTMEDTEPTVCPLCVQWRCAGCKSTDWPDCCEWTTDAEPYWPDGSVATLTQDDYCEPCATALAQYEADVFRGF